MEQTLERSEGQEMIDGLDTVDLGDAIVETKQLLTIPILPDSQAVWGVPF